MANKLQTCAQHMDGSITTESATVEKFDFSSTTDSVQRIHTRTQDLHRKHTHACTNTAEVVAQGSMELTELVRGKTPNELLKCYDSSGWVEIFNRRTAMRSGVCVPIVVVHRFLYYLRAAMHARIHYTHTHARASVRTPLTRTQRPVYQTRRMNTTNVRISFATCVAVCVYGCVLGVF